MIIYKITNKINCKVYIGQTIQTLRERWLEHCSKHSNCPAIKNAIKKYGKENFTVEQIDVACDRDELDFKEEYWIEYYDCISPKGYNLKGGGNHPSLSEETKQKIGNSNKGVKRSQEFRKRLSESMKSYYRNGGKHSMQGRKLTPEERKKLSDAHKGKYLGGNAYNAKRVMCVETGEIFECITAVERATGICSKNINAVVVGKRNRAGGFHWKYVDEVKVC